MEAECIAQEKEILEIRQSEAVGDLRTSLSQVRTPEKTLKLAPRGEEGVEFSLDDLLGLT